MPAPPPRRIKSEPINAQNAITVYQMVANAVRTLSRAQASTLLDRGGRRDVNFDCDYPDTITPQMYRAMYDREGIAARVVDVWPSESWKVMPELVDVDDPGVETAFEEAWSESAVRLCHYMERIDELSGIGHYGVLLLGFGDAHNGDLTKPAPGITDGDDPDEMLPPEGRTPPEGTPLLFMRTFDESLVEIVEMENDITSPRYGHPKKYRLTMADPDNPAAAPQDTSTREVHWSRVIHVAEKPTSAEWLSRPRQRPVYNRLLDLRKALGGSAEALYQTGFPGISFESLPGWEDADFDETATKQQVEMYMAGLQKFLTTRGMKANTLSGNLQGQAIAELIDRYQQNVATTIRVPWRVFAGSEQAKLASEQDSKNWNSRVLARNNRTLTPRLIRRLINRLIWVGFMPPPESGTYEVQHTDLNEPSPKDVADRAETLTRAMALYMDSGVDVIIPPLEFLTTIVGLSLDEAEAIVEAAKEYISNNRPEPAPPLNSPQAAAPDPDEEEVDPDDPDAQNPPSPRGKDGQQAERGGDGSGSKPPPPRGR